MSALFLFDVDSTLIDQEVIELIAAHAGVQAEVKEITDRAMAGELDFSESLRKRVSLLAGLSESVLEDVRADITLTLGARELISKLHELGNQVAVVSGGFTRVLEPLMKDLGIRHFQANQLEISNGKLTGKVIGEIVDREGKAAYLRKIAKELNSSRTFAIGDGANDIAMIQEADVGISFCGKAALNEVADVVILKRDLREVLNFL